MDFSPDNCGTSTLRWHINVEVASDSSFELVNSSSLPPLPPGTPVASVGSTESAALNGTIVVAGPLSLDPTDAFYSYSKVFRRSLEVFTQWLNAERGGVAYRGRRLGMRFVWVGDGSSRTQVARATAHALRRTGAHFAISGYSSGLTLFAAKQSAADGVLMVRGSRRVARA